MKTINLQGKEYAQVVERIKEFRKDCPNGLIETFPTIQEDGQVMFKAKVLKNKADSNSAEATGHSLGMNKGIKAFEKLETIAVGRALAMLGYASDGEIATGEEMEEFISFQEEKKDKHRNEITEKLLECKTLENLKEVWSSLTAEDKKTFLKFKEELKNNFGKNANK
jgi:hypothetical protein